MARELQIPDARITIVAHPVGGTAEDTLHAWADAALDDLIRHLAW